MFHFADYVNADASHCSNNEDDLGVLFPLEHFLRTGHTYAWDFGKEAARHYMEVDFCEWSQDPRQKGGLIPHTAEHFIGNVYPSHQWAEGLMDGAIERVRRAIPMLLRRGGHPLRRNHFLKELDARGLIDDRQVGNRAGTI